MSSDSIEEALQEILVLFPTIKNPGKWFTRESVDVTGGTVRRSGSLVNLLKIKRNLLQQAGYAPERRRDLPAASAEGAHLICFI